MWQSSQNSKLRSARIPQKTSLIRIMQLLTQLLDMVDEEGAETAGDEAAELPGSSVEEIGSPENLILGTTLPITLVCITRKGTEVLPTPMLSVVSMTTSNEMNPLFTEPSNKKERKFLRKARRPRKIPTWKKRMPHN